MPHHDEPMGWLSRLCGGGQGKSCGQAHHHGDNSASKHNALLGSALTWVAILSEQPGTIIAAHGAQ